MVHHSYRPALLRSIYLLAMMSCSTASNAMPYDLTLHAHNTCHLHLIDFYICCSIEAVIFAILIYSLIKCRQSKGVEAVHFHSRFWLEIVWTIIPFLILTALTMPAMIVLKHACG